MMGGIRAVFAAVLLLAAHPVLAGDQPLYAPAPDWAAAAPLPSAEQRAAGGLILFDSRQRIDGATVWNYADTAISITSPEALAQSSTVTLAWMPEKGDLIIHRLSIIRGDDEIDVLAQGQKFAVLRREEQLEQNLLTGILSATLAVEGLRVGDILRLRMSATIRDAALGGHVQLAQPLIAAPMRAGAARYTLTWPTDVSLRWRAFSDIGGADVRRNGAFSELTIALPVPKPDEIPDDAPARFQRFALIEASTFSDWSDVSRTMAPLYATTGTIADGSALADEVATIMAASRDPLRRTAMALRLVQDKVRYLAVAINDGNYVPQSPARTWELRYGDCKAKTLMLLAMLHAMGIEAEAVLAHSTFGDAVPGRVPSALAFDHVLVRATVGGDTLWLDGTKLGTRVDDLRDTPAFGHVLPLRLRGADLIAIAMRVPARPIVDLSLDADESTSVDLPSVIGIAMTVRGQPASMLTLASAQLPASEQRDMIEAFMSGYVGEAQYETLTMTPDVDAGSVTITGRGVFTTGWRSVDQHTERWLSRFPEMLSFAPDRARPAWSGIPVAGPALGLVRHRLRIRLPDGGNGYVVEGDSALDTQIAGLHVKRSAVMANGTMTVEETIGSAGVEIAVERIAAERDRLATIVARSPRLVAPAGARRRWNLDGAPSSSQRDAIAAIYEKSIGNAEPGDTTPLANSASFYQGIYDYKAAAEVFTRQLAIQPSKDVYLRRLNARVQLGNLAGALEDAQAARHLDPSSVDAFIGVARITAEIGDVAKAVAMLDERIALNGPRNDRYRQAKVAILGEFGDARAALAELDAMIAENPRAPALFNSRCWIKGTRTIDLDSALSDCTSAIELSDNRAIALDSRALVWLRLGRNEDALRDLDAALAQQPAQASSRFLRAIVAKRMGRTEQAASDLAIARRLVPLIDRDFARFGIVP